MKRNIIDRAFEQLAPGLALRRIQARAKLHVADKMFDNITKQQERKYDGAAKSRYHSDWYAPASNPNQEIMFALQTLRDRSRELGRNNPYAQNAFRVIPNNVVGTGIIPTPTKVRKSQEKALKDAWSSWAEDTDCDYDGNNTFYGLQHLIMRVVAESGECIIRRVRGTSNDDVPLRLHILEGDMINTGMHTGIWQSDGTITYYGIKFGKDGRRLGYWLYKRSPTEFGVDTDFVPAEDVIHVYQVERPGQIRGVPFSCGVMLRLRDLDDYELTERIRSKVAAAFAVFITEDNTSGEDPDKVKGLEKIDPGSIYSLNPGQQIQTAQPPSTDGFGEFVKNNLRGIASGFGTSYETLTGDYSNVNFSSGRMGWLEFNRNVQHLQYNLMIPKFCNKVYAWFVEACQFAGHIPFSVGKVKASWTPPRREMIDPLKEIQAIVKQLRSGLISWQEVVKQFGYIPEELQLELQKDKDMWDKLEMMPDSDPRFDNNRPPQELPIDDNGEEGKEIDDTETDPVPPPNPPKKKK